MCKWNSSFQAKGRIHSKRNENTRIISTSYSWEVFVFVCKLEEKAKENRLSFPQRKLDAASPRRSLDIMQVTTFMLQK